MVTTITKSKRENRCIGVSPFGGLSSDTKIIRSSSTTDVSRWDEKAGLRKGCGVRSQVIDALEAQEIKEEKRQKHKAEFR